LLSLALWRWSRVAGFAATAVFILLSPTSSILPIATEAGAERRMFLPSAALIAIVVCALFRLLQRVDLARARQRGAAALVVVAAAGLAASTMQRNAEFDDPVTIWRTTLDRWPTARAHYNLGIVLKAAGQRAEAIEEYRRALPDAAAAHYALAFELQADGRYAEAIDQYRMFIDSEPLDANVPRAYHQIGRAFLSLGRNEEATAAFRDTLARAPGNADARAGLADALMAMERWSDAVNAYQDYLRVNPGQPMALFNMGLALVRLDRDAEARDAFATVVRMQPDNVSAHVNLAFALANTGNYGDSVREFRRAAELEKDPAARADIEAAIGELLGAH
jgi:tetratricopeptide (TPR) repeat protein